MNIIAITSGELNSSSRRVEVFKDTYTDAAKWLEDKRDSLQRINKSRQGFSTSLEGNSLVTKGDNPMLPDEVIVYRVETFTVAEALNYILQRIR